MDKDELNKQLFEILNQYISSIAYKSDLDSKIDKIEGKNLSSNDFTDYYIEIINEMQKENEYIKKQLEGKAIYSNLRIFKPNFGVNALGSACEDATTLEEKKKLIDDISFIGIREIPYCLTLNEINGELFIEDNEIIIKDTYEYMKTLGIKIPCVHIYLGDNVDLHSNFLEKYLNGIEYILEKLKYIDYEYIIVWNERTDDLLDKEIEECIISALILSKKYKKKAGISLSGITPTFYVPQDILEESNFIAANIYPPCSFNNELSSVQDGINGWKSSKVREWVSYLDSIYPDKEILITETGILGYWSALLSPFGWNYDYDIVDESGKVMEIYYTGMFEVLKNTRITHIFAWFPHDIAKHKTVLKEIYNKYLNGGK